MPEYAKPVVGNFCWVELATNNLVGAKRFYGELFGWSLKEAPMPDGLPYTMAEVRGKSVCGLTELKGEAKKMGAGPHWLSYVAVDDPEPIVRKVAGLGGKTLVPTTDVGQGRLAIIQDTAGAVLALWQSKQSMGPWLYAEPGALCWNELITPELGAAEKFYTSLFGWKVESMDVGPGVTYRLFKNRGENAGGAMATPKELKGVPPNWSVYFDVANADQTVSRAERMGAKVLAPVMETANVGRYAMLQDGQGAAFGILQPARK